MIKYEKKQSMIKKTLIYLAGNFSSRIFSLLIIPIYAEYLSATELGQYDFQITVANLLMPLIGLAIWEAILRFGLKAEDTELKKIFSTAAVISSVILIFSFFILLGIYSNLYGFNTLSLLYVLMIILMPVVTILGYMSRAVKANKVFALAGVVASIVNITGILLFVVIMELGVFGLLLSTILSNFFNSLFLLVGARLTTYLSIYSYDKELGKKLISFSMPLIFNLTFGWFINSFSRFYINISLGATANGIYAFGSKFSGILLQFASIVNMAAIEDAIISSKSKNFVSRFEKNIENITTLFFNVCFILMPIIALYYNFVDNTDFKSSLILVPILLIVAILNNTSTLIGNVFPVFDKTSKAFITSLIAGIANFFFSIVLGYFFGLIGICLAQLFSTALLVLTRYIIGNKIVKYNVNWKKFIINILLFLIIATFSIIGNYIIQSLIFIVSMILFIAHYKPWLEEQIKKILVKI
ncbi:oligosaccharide flippase family protein [Desemzia sp. RIT804]|uniref:lipopolysaccharide biosynthesis protein n=1 Tax=Desemzia sp. RIT 804 TaxID=2810209 RepID=UPI00194F8B29|nr:oligosaccharide flippase family protein [Desemzia sp. RIT 804]MBM6615363.1 oligosaccharide flippase family protein [Desemzia sp. RIT 804]